MLVGRSVSASCTLVSQAGLWSPSGLCSACPNGKDKGHSTVDRSQWAEANVSLGGRETDGTQELCGWGLAVGPQNCSTGGLPLRRVQGPRGSVSSSVDSPVFSGDTRVSSSTKARPDTDGFTQELR